MLQSDRLREHGTPVRGFKSNPEFLQLKLCLSDGARGLKRERKQCVTSGEASGRLLSVQPRFTSAPSVSVCDSLRPFQDV